MSEPALAPVTEPIIAIIEKDGVRQEIRGKSLEGRDFTNAKFLPLGNKTEYRHASFLNCHVYGADFSSLPPDALNGAQFSANTRGLLMVKFPPKIDISKLLFLHIPLQDHQTGPDRSIDPMGLSGVQIDANTNLLTCEVSNSDVEEMANAAGSNKTYSTKTFPAHKALVLLAASAIYQVDGVERGIRVHGSSERGKLSENHPLRPAALRYLSMVQGTSLETVPDLPDVVMHKKMHKKLKGLKDNFETESFRRALNHDPLNNQETPSWDSQLHHAGLAISRGLDIDHPAIVAYKNGERPSPKFYERPAPGL